MCLSTVMPLLLPKYPRLSPNTPIDLLVTTPSIPQQKNTTAEHRGLEAVGRTPCLHHLGVGGNRKYLLFPSTKERRGFLQKPILFLLPSSPFLLFPSLERRHLIAEEPGLVTQEWLNTWIYSLLSSGQGRRNGLDLFMLDPAGQPHHAGGVGELGLGPGSASGVGSGVLPFLLQKHRGKAKRCCITWESLCAISSWEQCPLPAASLLKTSPGGKDCRGGNLLAARPQSGLWWNSSEGKGSSLNSSVHMDCPCSLQS